MEQKLCANKNTCLNAHDETEKVKGLWIIYEVLLIGVDGAVRWGGDGGGGDERLGWLWITWNQKEQKNLVKRKSGGFVNQCWTVIRSGRSCTATFKIWNHNFVWLWSMEWCSCQIAKCQTWAFTDWRCGRGRDDETSRPATAAHGTTAPWGQRGTVDEVLISLDCEFAWASIHEIKEVR